MNIVRPTRKEFVRFVIVEPLGVIVFWPTYYLLTEYGVWYANSALVGFALNTILYFFVYKFVVFRNKEMKQLRWEIEMYILVRFALFSINIYMLPVAVESWGMSYMWAQLFLTAVLSVISLVIFKFLFKDDETVQTTRIEPSCTV